ncbi:HK97 gp10 family phage protein [Fusobacterium varium]|uniref:HK97 gp10 family phage protein n=1 Tax=Fusobacterium varium TaxID=856 RepID=UPI0022E22C98|nr:HK97 gp10 family phage protein [Fusobacterium varium]
MSDWQKQMTAFENFEKDLQTLADKIGGKETKFFLKKQGKKFQKKTQEMARKLVKKRTGKYIESIKSGKVYIYDDSFATRVYSGARHAHLIENGHKAVTKGKKDTGKYVKGYRVFGRAKEEFEDEFEDNVSKYLNDICKENGF